MKIIISNMLPQSLLFPAVSPGREKLSPVFPTRTYHKTWIVSAMAHLTFLFNLLSGARIPKYEGIQIVRVVLHMKRENRAG